MTPSDLIDQQLPHCIDLRRRLHRIPELGFEEHQTAATLKKLADNKQLPVCVKLMWQPAEEGGGGASRLIDAGVLDGRIGPKVAAVFGLHGWPGLKVGTVATRPGALLAATNTWIARF